MHKLVVLLSIGFLACATIGCQPAANEPAGNEGEAAPEEASDANGSDESASVVPLTPLSESPAPNSGDASLSLTLGDPAPPLAIKNWVMGDPIEDFDSGEVYVVEFWATWCGPCRTSMPHLSELQEQYGDAVRIVGVTREDEGVVTGFLGEEQSAGKTWTEVLKYRLAIDERDATNNAYMRAAGQNGIPTAFIVGRTGLVEWIGHPMTMDEPLKQVVAGDWDRTAALAAMQLQERLNEGEMSQLLGAEQWDQALALLGDLEAEFGASVLASRIKLAILARAGRTEDASRVQAEIVDLAWDDAQTLNEFSWGIAVARGERDLDLAHKAAERASELRNHEDASILDTLARVYYEKGDLDAALHWQRKAAEHNNGHPEIDAALERYEAEAAER